MSQNTDRQDHILTALSEVPLDRIRLMKTLFLVWYRSGRPEDGPFSFKPYLYGPCAFDMYETLDALEVRGLVVQAPHYVERWGSYHLTRSGRVEAGEASRRLGSRLSSTIEETARWASKMSFRRLLERVYAEAPDFATKSVLRTGR